MYYHTRTNVSGQMLTDTDLSAEAVLKDILIPFINGQVVESDTVTNGNKILVNMKSALSVSIYKTECEISKLPFFSDEHGTVLNVRIEEYDVTHDFIEQAKQLQAESQGSSLLQKFFSSTKKQVFTVMQFGDKHLDSAYINVVKPLCSEYRLKAIRVDEIQDSGKINDQILENIASSKIVLVDLTGERPNCYYEAGFAHALGKNIIFTIRADSKIHFDLSNYRFIQWETELELKMALNERFKAILGEKA